MPPLWLSIVPVLFLILGLVSAVWIAGEDATSGPSQVMLILSGIFASFLSLTHGYYSARRNRVAFSFSASWKKLESAILSTIAEVMPAVLILLLIGALIGLWIVSGVVPALIVWGIALLDPTIFLFTACILSAVVSLVTGSSWSTAGTVGVALVGVGHALGMDPGMTAGAVVSGAYFGDKMSPFSETTNLAASMAGVELFDHIRHMMYTTIPGLVISLVIFLGMGYGITESSSPVELEKTVNTIQSVFWIHPALLAVPLFTFFLIYRRIPAVPAILLGSLLGAAFAALFQSEALAFADQKNMPAALLQSASNGLHFATGQSNVDSLLGRGGMSSMLTTIWLILSAMFFAGIMEGSGMIQSIATSVLKRIHSTGGLISGTIFGGLFANIVTSEQYLSIVVNGRFFREAYKQRGLSPLTLSRSLEDSGTLTSALVPWNTCGAFMAATLQTPVFLYAPFAFLNWITPLIGILYAWTGTFLAPAEQKRGGKSLASSASPSDAEG
ncbi:MAG: Na+/H+ antiporter NhaC [Leptospiraceae bacterium]|nr:Na+/H+ antiporter NhaC [Leptospiraceae bacterium]